MIHISFIGKVKKITPCYIFLFNNHQFNITAFFLATVYKLKYKTSVITLLVLIIIFVVGGKKNSNIYVKKHIK